MLPPLHSGIIYGNLRTTEDAAFDGYNSDSTRLVMTVLLNVSVVVRRTTLAVFVMCIIIFLFFIYIPRSDGQGSKPLPVT